MPVDQLIALLSRVVDENETALIAARADRYVCEYFVNQNVEKWNLLPPPFNPFSSDGYWEVFEFIPNIPTVQVTENSYFWK